MTKATKLFVGNYKGGVGKTTSIYQLALHMVTAGKKVLLIDLDPQCSLSEICLYRNDLQLNDLNDYESLNYIYDMWILRKKFPTVKLDINTSSLIKQTKEGIYYIPSNIFYSNGGLDELALNLSNDFYDLLPMQQFFLENQIEKDYDYILYDCPPSNTIITQGAFLLSDYYIIPTVIQTLSIRGVIHYIKTIDSIFEKRCMNNEHSLIAKASFGKKPVLLGIFETLKKSTVNYTNELAELTGELNNTGVKTKQPNYLFSNGIKNSESIARKTANGEICEEYGSLADEIVGCVEDRQTNTVALIGEKRWLK